MNKLLLIFSLAVFLPANAPAETILNDAAAFNVAKAVKLGRGKTSMYNADTLLSHGGESGGLAKTCSSQCLSCDTATGTCQSCPSGYFPDGSGCSKCASIANGKCLACYSDARIDCSVVSCDEGYIQDVPDPRCMELTCDDYQRRSGTSCVGNCTGVVCKSGYTPTATLTGCCCEEDTSCSSGYSYNTTYKGCIKDTYTCNIGCNVNGCGIGSTLKPDTGYYIKSDGTCPACSTAIANCAACSISKLGATPTCTKCNSGYTLSAGKCVAAITCPSNCSTCSSSSTCTKCSSGYYLSSGSCVSCPLNATCTGTSTFTCNSGYTKYNNLCRTDPCDGTSTTPAWCQDGLTRVAGKGCCPSGYTSSTQCLQCAVSALAL